VDSGGLIDRYFGAVELENDSGGLWWTVNRVHGIQKVKGLKARPQFLRFRLINQKARASLYICRAAVVLVRLRT